MEFATERSGDGPRRVTFYGACAMSTATCGSWRLVGPDSEPDGASREPSLDWTLGMVWHWRANPWMTANQKRRASTVAKFAGAVDKWVAITGDPSFSRISIELCDQFVAELCLMPGRRGTGRVIFERFRPDPDDPDRWYWRRDPDQCNIEARAKAEPGKYWIAPPMSANTVRSICRHVEALFRWAGPRTKKCKAALTIYPDVHRLPWLDPPDAEEADEEKIFSIEELRAWLNACHLATLPIVGDVAPCEWWQSLIRFLFNTTLRIGSALAIEWDWIRDRTLVIPKHSHKTGRHIGKLDVPLNDEALDAIERVRRPGRKLVFELGHCSRGHLDRVRKKLQRAAGIPLWGFHAIRGCSGDTLWRIDHDAAQYGLGHTAKRMTTKRYVRRKTLTEALEKMPALAPKQRLLF